MITSLHFKSCRSGAFSLVELLVVVAVIGLMSAMTLGGLGSSEGAKFISQCWELRGVLQNAREFAKAKRTYVLVGFTGVMPDSLLVSLYYSADGANNLAAANLVQARRPVLLSGIRLADALSTTPNAADLLQESDLGPINISQSGKSYSTSNLLEFSPDGSVRVLASGGQAKIGIPLITSNGGTLTADILLGRLSGNVEIARN
jgi:prepilin-type N-terminal cleavage/methylation domain-containing protein